MAAQDKKVQLSFTDWFSLDKNAADYKEKKAYRDQEIGRLSSVGSTIFGAASKISQGMDEAFRLNMQATVDENNITLMKTNDLIIQQTTQNNINEAQERGMVFKGGQVEQMSQSGFDVSSASYQNLLDNTDFQIAKNVAALKMNEELALAQSKYNQQMTALQASLYRKQAKQAKTSGYLQAAATLAKGF